MTVVRFPLPAPPYDPAKRTQLQRGQELPDGVQRLFPVCEPEPVASTPTTAFMTALAASLSPKVYTGLTGRLGAAARDGDASALMALQIITGGQ